MTLQERLARVKLLCCDWDGCFTDNHVYTFGDGSEAIRTSRADGIGIERLKKLGVRIIVITSEPPFTAGHRSIVDVRCAKLGLEVRHAIPPIDKLAHLYTLSDDFEEVAYLGNDINDLPCLRVAGVPILVNDAEPALHKVFSTPGGPYLSRGGGDGAVREVADLIADAIEQHKPNLQRVAEALA